VDTLKQNLPKSRSLAAGQNIKERDYWLDKLSGELVFSTFPYDHKKTDGTGKVRTPFEFQLPESLYSRIMSVSKNSDLRMFVVLLAGMVLLLDKYSGNKDIIVGVPIYKQDIEAEFVNSMLAVRTQLKDDIKFKEFLMDLSKTLYEANENQNYPIEALLYKLNLSDSGDDAPLFDVVILLENLHDKDYIRDINPGMLVSLLRTDGGITGSLEYNPRLYEESSVERIVKHFINLLREGLSNVDSRLSGIEILSPEEKKELLFDFNDAEAEHPVSKTVHQLFEEQAAKTDGKAALAFEGRHMTYGELNEKADRLAWTLRQKGVSPDTIIGIMVERSFEMIVGMLAIMKAGGAYMPMDPDYPEGRVRYMMEDTNTSVLLIQDHIAERNKTLPEETEILIVDDERVYGDSAPEPAVSHKNSNLAYIIYTSGSTGKPKGVCVEHKTIINTLSWRKECYKFDGGDVFLQVPSFSFDSSVEDIFSALISGAELVLIRQQDRLDPEYLRELIETNKVTHFLIVPSFYKTLLEEIPESLQNLGTVTIAGEGFTEDLVARHFERLPNARLFNEYGPTENSVCATVYEFSTDRTKVLIGKAIDNVRCYVLDRNLNLAPIGVSGELYISGKGLARGYLNQPELTEERFAADPFFPGERMYRTGDFAKWSVDGILEFLGRLDHQVKIRGYRIELGEIENELLRHDNVKDAVIIADGEEENPYLCAYLVPAGSRDDGSLDVQDLREHLMHRLPAYMVPSYFIPLPRIPLTTNGKVDRKALPAPEIGGEEEFEAPRDETEEQLAVIWSELIGMDADKISVHANFFELGGHSLKATLLVSRIHKTLDAVVPLAEVFNTPDIRRLAGYIKKAKKDKFLSMEPAPRKDHYLLSSAQRRLYIMQQVEPDLTAYNIPIVALVEGKLDIDRLEYVFRGLVERHESFRTSFETIGGTPLQKILDHVDFEIAYFDNVEDGAEEQLMRDFVRPFDLSRPPLFRVGVIKKEEEKYFLMVDMHHIVTDGVSSNIFIDDFRALYEGKELPPLRLQYKDFSEWQNSDAAGELAAHQKTYWLERFSGDIPHLNLSAAADYDEPNVKSYQGDVVDFIIGSELFKKLEEFTNRTGTTVFIVLLSVYYVLLYRYTGQQDIVVGTPITGRRHTDLMEIIGMFVNMLALRNRPEDNKTFAAFLSEVKKDALDAYENQDFQFEQLVSELGLQGTVGRNPLFDVVFAMQKVDVGGPTVDDLKGFGHLKITPWEFKKGATPFDLLMTAFETDGKINMSLEFSTALFKRSTIEVITKYYVEILQQVVENPDLLLKDIDISSDVVALESTDLQDHEADFGF
jgi:amino acid adenylation domain-containing protein